MPKLKVDFSGTVEIDSDNVNFLYIGDGELLRKNVITGTEYMGLSADDKSDYVLESIVDVLAKSHDLMMDDINVFHEDEKNDNSESIYRIC